MLDNELIYLTAKQLNCVDYFSLMRTCKQYYNYLRCKRISCLFNSKLLDIYRSHELGHKKCTTILPSEQTFRDYKVSSGYRLFGFCKRRICTSKHIERVKQLTLFAHIHEKELYSIDRTELRKSHINCYFEMVKALPKPFSILCCAKKFIEFLRGNGGEYVVEYITNNHDLKDLAIWDKLITQDLTRFISQATWDRLRKDNMRITLSNYFLNSKSDPIFYLLAQCISLDIYFAHTSYFLGSMLLKCIDDPLLKNITFVGAMCENGQIETMIHEIAFYHKICVQKKMEYLDTLCIFLNSPLRPAINNRIHMDDYSQAKMAKCIFELIKYVPHPTQNVYSFAQFFDSIDAYRYLRYDKHVPFPGIKWENAKKTIEYMICKEKITKVSNILVTMDKDCDYRFIKPYITKYDLQCSQNEMDAILQSNNDLYLVY